MSNHRNKPKSEKPGFHSRNPHNKRYDLESLSAHYEPLKSFVAPNKYGDLSVDFADPNAVLALNGAILSKHYGIAEWSIPNGYLCPPLPGRADLIHHAADLLEHNKRIPTGMKIRVLDVGVGANCVYPIIGNQAYGWSFIGSDIDPIALENAQCICSKNEALSNVELRIQNSADHILKGIVKDDEYIDLCICNPPFFTSSKEAEQASRRKTRNLSDQGSHKVKRNFGGKHNELWCDGGERSFVAKLIRESADRSRRCYWFSSLISQEANLSFLKNELKMVRPEESRVIDMGHGNKKSRMLAWTFLNKKQQKLWREARWT